MAVRSLIDHLYSSHCSQCTVNNVQLINWSLAGSVVSHCKINLIGDQHGNHPIHNWHSLPIWLKQEVGFACASDVIGCIQPWTKKIIDPMSRKQCIHPWFIINAMFMDNKILHRTPWSQYIVTVSTPSDVTCVKRYGNFIGSAKLLVISSTTEHNISQYSLIMNWIHTTFSMKFETKCEIFFQ